MAGFSGLLVKNETQSLMTKMCNLLNRRGVVSVSAGETSPRFLWSHRISVSFFVSRTVLKDKTKKKRDSRRLRKQHQLLARFPENNLAMRLGGNSQDFFFFFVAPTPSPFLCFHPLNPSFVHFQLIKGLIPPVNSANLVLYHTATFYNSLLLCSVEVFRVLS